MKVAVAGGRDFTNEKKLAKVLNNLPELGFAAPTLIISGMATGADQMAYEWARTWGVTFTGHPPLYDEVQTMGFARAARRRNTRIVADADLVVAFPTQRSKGTWHTIALAKKLGVPCIIYQDWKGTLKIERPEQATTIK